MFRELRESKEIKNAEKEMLYEEAGELEAKIFPALKEVSESLNQRGFPVDENCRIKIENFKNIFGEHTIAADKKMVEKIESKFSKEENKNIGELLEGVKTVSFNKLWSNNRLVSLRTSKFDDYFNGIDEVIFGTETHQPLAAIDTTTNIKEKTEKVIDKIKNGSQIKYGFYIKDGIKRGSLNDLPTFIISLKPEELLQFAGNLVQNDGLKDSLDENNLKVKKQIFTSLKIQSNEFEKIAAPKMKHSYEVAGQIFDDLLNF